MFDLACDPHEVHGRLSRDPLFRKLRPGTRLPGCWDPFELGVRAILGQQISVAAATTLAGRLAALLGDPNPYGLLFPSPRKLAGADIAKIGLPGRRADSLRSLAEAAATGRFGTPGATLEETIHALRELPGVGPWTAQYLAMRAFQEPDAFPSGDLALRKAAGNLTARQLEQRAESWRPWRAYAAINLWRLYANQALV
jgi:3-methyladenine DNA glycosylase/8-oxoguanine DNA glycosylase